MRNRIRLFSKRVVAYADFKSRVGVLVLAAMLGMTACGIKAPPIPPRQIAPPPVSDLQYRIADGELILTWSVPAATWERQPDLAGFAVYRSKSELRNGACKNCPLLFQRIAQVPLVVTPQRKSVAAKLSYRERLAKGYHYTYKVVSRTASHISGADSNLISFDY